MRNKMWIAGAALALVAGAVAWHTHQGGDQPGEISAGVLAKLCAEAGEHGTGPREKARDETSLSVARSLGNSEESDAPEVIDLTPSPQLPESAEPPVAPPSPMPDSTASPTPAATPTPVVPDFLPHSADGDETPRPDPAGASEFWRQVTAFVWRLPASKPPRESEMHRHPSSYHEQHPGCPYQGGCPYDAGQSHYYSARKPVSEEQDAPPAKRNWFTR